MSASGTVTVPASSASAAAAWSAGVALPCGTVRICARMGGGGGPAGRGGARMTAGGMPVACADRASVPAAESASAMAVPELALMASTQVTYPA